MAQYDVLCPKTKVSHFSHFYPMTSDGGVRDFVGRTMEVYSVSNIPRIAAFQT